MEVKFEQSDKECCTTAAGLYFVGKAINKNTSLRQELKKIKTRLGISNMDLVRACARWLVLGIHHYKNTAAYPSFCNHYINYQELENKQQSAYNLIGKNPPR